MTGPEPDAAPVRVIGLTKHFKRQRGEQVVAVDDVSLEVGRGEMVVILGPSGCGKTTLLRCVAGLETPTGGEIHSNGRVVSSARQGVQVPPERRGFGMMFQSYAVWPHMSVRRNVSYPLAVRRVPKAELTERVERILRIVGIAGLAEEYPAQLSGGQQQRVALARCLVADPDVILFDEPLSNVDAKVREELRVELLTMQQRIGFAGIFVTHDQEEATAIADRVVVMCDGAVEQVGPPREVYRAPRTRFVAGFLGVVNEWVGTVQDTSGPQPLVRTPMGEIAVAAENVPSDVGAGDQVAVIARPEVVAVSSDRPDGAGPNVWPATLTTETFRGPYVEQFLEVNGQRVRARGAGREHLSDGQRVFAAAAPRDLRVLAAGDAADDHARDASGAAAGATP
ncbi:ABC transporter ATP-binding protein [Jiangella asiatica]|uniref:ABC transporter ATP-binding protein n=1 Tax=Jiangella asiatica TaxID=2530372 RepID=A0A4R5CU10_9ACTN|nr:ABC transporter ATP-binding protein [Jiangella asiatica]TDE03117.1 ABC transporter ATP-binding protein [Jiangella asiatica]